MTEKKLIIPNSLIRLCANPDNNLSYRALGLFVKVRLESDGVLNGSSAYYIASRFKVKRLFVQRVLPILIDAGLFTIVNNSIVLISDEALISRYNDYLYVNVIDFSSCVHVCDYSDRLKLSLIHLKISQTNFSSLNNKDEKKDITKNSMVKSFIKDLDPDVNKCLFASSFSKLLSCSSMSIHRLIHKEEKLGHLTIKRIFYDVTVNEDPISITFAKVLHINRKTHKVRIDFGSVFEVFVVKNIPI
jgi:hypothetical protein